MPEGDDLARPMMPTAWSVGRAVIRKDLLQSFLSHRLGFGFLCASLFQASLVYLQLSSSMDSPLAMSWFFVPNVLFLSAMASFVCLGSVTEEREGGLFALEIASPASRFGLAWGKIGFATLVAALFFFPMFVTLPASRSLYGYYPFSKIFVGLGIAFLGVLAYAWGTVALGTVLGRKNLSTTVLSLWIAATAWFQKAPFERVPAVISIAVPADAVRLSVFKLFWQGADYTLVEGVSINQLLLWPLAILGGSFLAVTATYLLLAKRCDIA